jgi:hypothetical protein
LSGETYTNIAHHSSVHTELVKLILFHDLNANRIR